MINAARELPFPIPDEDEFEVTITVRSWKHDCHSSYRLNRWEIENDKLHEIVRFMTYRLQDFIQEKENAASEGTQGKDSQRLQ